MKIVLFIFILIALFACRNNVDNDIINDINETRIIASKMDFHDELPVSFYSFIQANESGLYVTPSNPVNDSVLYKYSHNKTGECCMPLYGIIREGRGPLELQSVNLSTKTANGDTLLFYSFNDSKYLLMDNTGKVFEHINTSVNVLNTGSSFAYSNGYLLLPTFGKMLGRDHLLTILKVSEDTQYDFFEPRVPPGFEPSIRNLVFPMGAIPDGFAISFLGDRKVYILGFDGEIKRELIFGQSDPIPSPFTITNPVEGPSSRPYVTKIEFHKGNLYVLIERMIWILDYPSFEAKKKIAVIRNQEENSAPVIDFSVTDDIMYLRIGNDGLYYIQNNPD
jgi:hypothetical protein